MSSEAVDHVHDSSPSPGHHRQRQLRADDSGFSMSWKAFAFILALLGGGGTIWSQLGILSKGDLDGHDRDVEAHDGLAGKVEATTDAVKALGEKVDEHGTALMAVRNGFYDFRAEQIADEAAKLVRGRDESREVFKRVKAQAIDNLTYNRPVRMGLEKYFEQ